MRGGVIIQNKYQIRQRIHAYKNGSEYNEIIRDGISKYNIDYNLKNLSNCPDANKAITFIVFGQSNVANYVVSPHEMPRAMGVKVFYNGKCFEAKDPLPGASGDRGSLWTRLADKIGKESSRNRILIIPIAVANTKVNDWAPGGTLNDLLERRLEQMKDMGYFADFAIMQIGESDGGDNTDLMSFRMDYEYLANRLKKISNILYISPTSGCGSDKNLNIRAAELEIGRSVGASIGVDMDSIGRRYRANICHLTPDGADIVSSMWASLLKDRLVR